MHDPLSSKLEITLYILEEPRSKLGRHYIGLYEIIDLKYLNNVILWMGHNKFVTKYQDKLKIAYTD
jgi:hypothetical protein